mmetsp:Transcript_10335/g.39112  ORF Transcript_10335/g.39112 Transcript_10335/m.39112 type:complete len:635 (-) Transcript_10335:48-1952(-)|eukprot:scaffold743_cov267-Pinguiococcus_pyrenoidosus.AAC.12
MSGAAVTPTTPISSYFSKKEEKPVDFSFEFDVAPGSQKKRRTRGGKGKNKSKKTKEVDTEAAANAIAEASYANLPDEKKDDSTAEPSDATDGTAKNGASNGGHRAPPATPPPSTLDKNDNVVGGEWQDMDIKGVSDRNRKQRWFERMLRNAYGDLDMSDLSRIAMLSSMLFFIIGGYWLLRSCKDPIITHIVGIEWIPTAKIMSLFVVLAAVYVYNVLVDIFPKHQLFYIVGGFYILVFMGVSVLLRHPTIGMPNAEASPHRFLGWLSYFAIESFGSIVVSLFWQFTNANVDLKTAKSAYGLIVAGAQIGSILGPTIATNADSIGMPNLYLCGALAVTAMVVVVYFYVQRYGPSADDVSKEGKKKEKTGALEGLKLMQKHDYVRGIFAISCLFMVEVTILDYMMKKLAYTEFIVKYPGDPQRATKAFGAFMGSFGQMTNLISFAFSLTGTSFVIRRFGLNRTLLAFPSLCCAAITMVFLFPQLYVVFAAMMLLKAFSYALNNPCKEILYQPTSSAVKFKCKSWIDTFGARGSKALGSLVTNSFTGSVAMLVTYGSVIAGGCSGFLVWVAWWMGQKFDEYVENDTVVGEEVAQETVFGLEEEDEEAALLNAQEGKGGGADDDDQDGGDDDEEETV